MLSNHRGELLRRGHEVLWLSSRAASQGAPQAGHLCYGTTGKLRGLIQLANPAAARTLERTVAGFRPDVIHVGMFLTQLSPSILPVLARTPAVYHAQWYRPICLTGTRVLPGGEACTHRAGVACLRERCVPVQDWVPLAAGLARFRRNVRAFRRVIANSDYVRSQLNQWGCPCAEVIRCAVEERAQRPPLTGPPMAAFAGRLVRSKGAHHFIEAARQFAAARFVVAGEGPERQALEAAAPPNVEFLGHLSREEMERRFAAAWVQAVPSTWQEPFGLTAAEAQMRGTAVVASAAGGLAEVIADGTTGLLVPAADSVALAAALRRLLEDRTTAEAMGQAGRARAMAEFALHKFTDRFLAAYSTIMGELDVPFRNHSYP